MKRKLRRLGVSLAALSVGFILFLGDAAPLEATGVCQFCSANCAADLDAECAEVCGPGPWLGACHAEPSHFCRDKVNPNGAVHTYVCIRAA